MKRMLLLLVVLCVGCGTTVEVPPAHVGKLSTASGLQKGIIPPSKLRLSNMCLTCDDLILAEASDWPVKETLKIFMPKDKLNLVVDVRGTFAVSDDQSNVEKIFARVPAASISNQQGHTGRVFIIPMEKVYATYAQPIIREGVRSIMIKYSIMDVMENRDEISQEILVAVSTRLSRTPISAIEFGLADLQPPTVIVAAQEKAKEREIAIQQAEADKMVRLKQAEAALEVAIKQQEVDLKEAETQVLVNKKLAEGVNKAFIAQRALRVLETLAKSDNKVFFMPTEALENPAVMIGAVKEGFKK